MKIGFNLAALAVVSLVLCGSAVAQWDTDGPNAALTLNGQSPDVNDPIGHDVSGTLPGTQVIEITSGANPAQAVILMASPLDPTGAVLAGLPWGGSIDIGAPGSPISNVTLVGDGLGLTVNPTFDIFFATDNGNALLALPPTFLLAFNAGTALNGARVAFQAIMQDMTAAPFFLDNTQAGDLNLFTGQSLIALTGDDGSVNIPFVPGNTFNFHGQSKADIWVNGNGYVNFDGLTTVAAGGFTRDNVSAVNAEPAILLGMCDWSPSGNNFNEGVLYSEVGNFLSVIYGDPSVTAAGIPHFADIDVNMFSVDLELNDGSNPNEGQFTINTTTLDPTAVTDNGNGLLGHTPGGGVIAGGAFDINLRTGVNVGLANEAQLEEHDADGFAVSTVGFDGLGTPRGYNNYTINWTGNSTQFLPSTAVTTGDQGYTSIPLGGAPADDVTGFTVASISTAGGQIVEIGGSYVGFDPMALGTGMVTFDPAGVNGGPFPAAVIGVLDDSGASGAVAIPNGGAFPQHRDAQALQIATPAFMVGGIHACQVDFDSGASFTIAINVVAPGAIVTSYTLGDDSFISHALTVPIQYYGLMFNNVILNSNGYVTFDAGSGDFTESFPEFFGGWGTAGNEGVALVYSDMNSGGTGSGATYDVTEDTILGTVTCQFNNQNHWASVLPAGSFACTFDNNGGTLGAAGSVRLDLSAFTAGNAGDNFISGVTDGDTTTLPDTDLTGVLDPGSMMPGIGGAQAGGRVSPGSPESIGEQTAGATAPTFSIVTMLETGVGLWFTL